MKKMKTIMPILDGAFPALDFSNVQVMSDEEMDTKYSTATNGVYVRSTNTIIARELEDTSRLSDEATAAALIMFMHTFVHEAIHRYTKDPKKSHGKRFQRNCIKFGFDPYMEIGADKTAKLMKGCERPITGYFLLVEIAYQLTMKGHKYVR